MELQTRACCREHRSEDARSEILRAADVFERIGATNGLERCRARIRNIGDMKELDTSGEFL